jgi:hypothetical protein
MLLLAGVPVYVWLKWRQSIQPSIQLRPGALPTRARPSGR